MTKMMTNHTDKKIKLIYFYIYAGNYRRQHIKGNMADAQTINTQNELIEKSPPERKRIISMGICVYAETYRRQSTRENTARDGQAVVNIDIQDESTKTNLLENKYDVQLIDYSNIQGKPQFTPPNVLYDKTSYIIRWLEDVSNQLADIRSQDARCTCNSSSNRFHTESGLEKNSEDYNKVCNINNIFCLYFRSLKKTKFYLGRRCTRYTAWHFYIILQKRGFESASSGKGKCRN